MPEHETYHASRQVCNAMIDKRPQAIVYCKDVADVIAAVNFGRDHGLSVAVRGGGHSGPGFGVCENGFVIDLSLMDGVRVDPVAKTASLDGGCVWGGRR